MTRFITAAMGVAVVLGLAGCGGAESNGANVESSAVTSTTSTAATTTSSRETTTVTSSSQPAAQERTATDAYTPPAPASRAPAAAPPAAPPFMRPEDYDPYGPPRFVQCWERNAAVMSDGSIVTDTVNCAPSPAPAPAQEDLYEDPPRTDGCVGPAAVCGYYDESGNPVWFDKMTGETSPRYFDEFGNPTMEPN